MTAAINLNNLNYFENHIKGLISQAISALKFSLPDSDLFKLKKEFEAVKNEIKNDFIQKIEPKKDIKIVKPEEKRIEPKIIRVPTRMVYPSFKSFKQTKQEVFKEFMSYLNKILDVFENLKIRFKELKLEKYKNVLKKLALDVADKLFKKERIIEAVLKGVNMNNFISREAQSIVKSAMTDSIIGFLKDNPNPNDTELHVWAEKNKYNIHEVETVIYTLATKFVKFWTGGRANKEKFTEDKVDSKELEAGIKVEYEHLDNEDDVSREIAKRIALDHLAETYPKTYYTGKNGLLEMEKRIAESK